MFKYVFPWALVLSFPLIYFISPEFYLHFIIHPIDREMQFVEKMTIFCSFSAGLLLMGSAFKLKVKNIPVFRQGDVALVLLLGLAALFFFGEEISWGQTYFQWETPDQYKKLSVETNLHNTDIPVQSMGSLFIICVFFVLPFIRRHKFIRNVGLKYAIPELPAIHCMAVGFVWKLVKTVYMHGRSVEELKSIPVYVNFYDQINEHKEMIIALGLLYYAIQIYKFSKGMQKESSQASPAL